MSKMDEVIVVAPRRLVFGGETHTFHGFQPLVAGGSGEILQGLGSGARTARRGDVEEDFELLQPIPYVVLTRQLDGCTDVFTYTRLVGGGEVRLHGRLSIGVGGHMNRPFEPSTLAATVAEEAARELREELSFTDEAGREAVPELPRLIGLINDDTGEVQRVHIGILAVVEVPATWSVGVRETDSLEGRWRTTEELRKDEARGRLEEWSVHALAGIGG